MEPVHVPVMLEEVVSVLPLRPGAVVVDGTVGLAGHAMRMAELLRPGGLIVGLDWDSAMLARAEERLSGVEGVAVRLFASDYRELRRCLTEAAGETGHPPQADAILLDLGLNSAQIEDPERGISFSGEGRLDMRMDRSRNEPASALLNRASASEIEKILAEYGDERWARKIAQAVVDRRKTKPLQTTQDLVECVLAAIPPAKREKRIHPATRTFQALRIAVNHELDGLEDAFVEAAGCLAPQGVLAILSYHSGEDRAAKRAAKRLSENGFEEVFAKPRTPSESEIRANPRSRSAKLRAVRRTKESP